jgi:2-haloacid dehalogenase
MNHPYTMRVARTNAWRRLRTALAASALAAAGTLLLDARAPAPTERAAPSPRYKAVAFDYLVLFDPDSVVPEVERVAPGQGRSLVMLWRTRQFEYTWLRAMSGRYADFQAITEDALVYAAQALRVPLGPDEKRRLVAAFLHLRPWPDSVETLRTLRRSGVRVIALANFSPEMLRANAEQAGMLDLFDALVSTDANHTYKPDPRAYGLGLRELRLPKRDVLFAAFGGWDAAGAAAFGYPTCWVNRLHQPAEELGVRPDRTVADLEGLLDVVLGDGRAR